LAEPRGAEFWGLRLSQALTKFNFYYHFLVPPMSAPAFHIESGPSAHNPPDGNRTAFTLIELLVIIAILALLAVMLLPALAGTQSQSKVTACTARYRQWTIAANLYANDSQERLPSFDPYGGGSYAWDVGTNFCYALYPYGMNVPVWFCPMRPNEWNAANIWAQLHFGQPIQTIRQLTYYFSHSYSGEINLRDNYWVPRNPNGAYPPIYLPTDWSTRPPTAIPGWVKGAASTTYGWPTKLHDIASAHVPFVSDVAACGLSAGLVSPNPVSTNISNISPNTAHFVNGTLIGVNAAFVDGHVEDRSPSQMKAVYESPSGTAFWFY
jgi:prepilin-type processing-associated H-X9-DG protein